MPEKNVSPKVSPMDERHLALLRENVGAFMRKAASEWALAPGRLLDIAPQDHEGARPFFSKATRVETIDISADAGCTHTGDICERNASLADDSFDYVVCTEVLEHTLRPFDAIREIERILKPGGLLFVSTPFNLRIHGPLPDCWRFTEHGLRALLDRFEILSLEALETPDRWLMPIQYTVVARKAAGAEASVSVR